MRLQRPLGDATPPPTLAKRLGCPVSSQVFARKEAGREDLVATSQMVPTLVIKAEHMSRILHKSSDFRLPCKIPSVTLSDLPVSATFIGS
jgi:hypothetical protein